MCILAGFVVLGLAAAALPSGFLGTWVGIPQTSPLGPWDEQWVFAISEAQDGTGFLMEDIMNATSDIIPDSVQRFYIDATTGYLTYCGVVNNFFTTNKTINGTVSVFLAPQTAQWNDKQMVWCMAEYGCGAIQWTMTLVDANTLTHHVVLFEPVNHLKVTMMRTANAPVNRRAQALANPSPTPHKCDYSPPELTAARGELPDGHPKIFTGAKCPYLSPRSHLLPRPDAALALPPQQPEFTFCYTLNPKLELQLRWNHDAAAQTLTIQLSAPVPSAATWIAIGFAPQFPYMKGADIVLGYISSDNVRGVEFCFLWKKTCLLHVVN